MKTKSGEIGKRVGRKKRKGRKYFDFAFKLRIVKLYLEESIPKKIIIQESGISPVSLDRWIGQYRKKGEFGLQSTMPSRPGKSIPGPVRERIIKLKQDDPNRGVRFISSLLQRFSLLKASPETVRKTLHEEKLITPEPKKRHIPRNKKQLRFFERATPNQMWQSDIFTFFLNGSRVYLIGFMDDNSRFMTTHGLYWSQTAENVVETYRKGIGEYGPPKEMLTDNGRQYVAWRGTGKFPKELQKNGVHHIRSTPHHPMTLGKIERFWKTIHEDFIGRAQFASFDEAQERIRLWIQYYNHQRPHQSLEGLCPADRYFKLAAELQKTIEAGIKGNLLEMALHGKPKEPFYMVGRMGGKSVVMREEKGTFQVSVESHDAREIKGVEYLLPGESTIHTTEKNHGEAIEAGEAGKNSRQAAETHVPLLECCREMPGGAVDMDRAAETDGDMSGVTGELGHTESVGEAGVGRNAACAGTADEAGTEGPGVGQAVTVVAGAKRSSVGDITGRPLGRAFAEAAGDTEPERIENIAEGVLHGAEDAGGSGAAAGVGDFSCAERRDNGTGGSESSGHIAEDVLRVGTAGTGGNGGCAGEPFCRQTCGAEGYREGNAAGTGQRPGATAVCDGEVIGSTGDTLTVQTAEGC